MNCPICGATLVSDKMKLKRRDGFNCLPEGWFNSYKLYKCSKCVWPYLYLIHKQILWRYIDGSWTKVGIIKTRKANPKKIIGRRFISQ